MAESSAECSVAERDPLQRRIAELEAENARLRRAEAMLRARLEDFAAATGGWFWETDADLRFTYMSRSVETFTGVSPEWHYGQTREDIGVPQSVTTDAWAAHLGQLAAHEPFSDFTFERAGPDGVRWMRTGGKPVFDDTGTFRGYRGAALDVTARIAAEHRSAHLTAAVEALAELFALWDEDDRLVLCNEKFREINAPVAHTTEPGTPFSEHIQAALAHGLYPAAQGREAEWLAARLEHHRRPKEPFELERQDGRWLLVHEQRLPHGATVTISTDITARKRTEMALREKADILEASFRTVPDGILVLDRGLRPRAWNERLFEVLAIGDDVDQAVHAVRQDMTTALVEVISSAPEDARAESDPVPPLSMAIVASQSERQLASGDFVEARISPMADGGCVAVYRDINETKRLQLELERQATIDALTGVLNRRQFFEIADQELARAARYRHSLSLLVLDIDGFKAINDTHGHAVGDAALRLVAQTCQRHLRRVDSFGRIGGEEFAIVLPIIDGVDAEGVAEKLRALIEATELAVPNGVLRLTASFGVAQWPGQRETIQQLTDRADAALYEAKRSGRNRVCLDRRYVSSNGSNATG